MPPHLKKRSDRRNSWYIVDGTTLISTKTDKEEHAKVLLEQYCRDRLGIPKTLRFDKKAHDIIKQFGKPDHQSSIKKLRFPCVYAFIRDGSIIYIGSSINGFARVLASHHPMVTNAEDSDEKIFWVVGNESAARELELKMIREVKPPFNSNSNGEIKSSGYMQRTQNFPELRKVIRETIRGEIKSLLKKVILKGPTANPQPTCKNGESWQRQTAVS